MTCNFASALSRDKDTAAAMQEVCRECTAHLDGPPDLAVVFLSAHHAGVAASVAEKLMDQLDSACLLGGTGESIVGVGTEIEMEPALSLWVAKLPDVSLVPMHLQFARTPEGGSFVGWPDELIDAWPQSATLLLIGDPFSFPSDVLLERLNEDRPGVPIVGGLCSGGQQPGSNRLVFNENTFDSGAVAVLLHGAIDVRTVVSQGCRPIGEHLVITHAERNVIYELGGRPAYQKLEELFRTLATHEQQMMQRGLHVGRVVSEYQDSFEQGDFLVRNVVGVEPEEGAIAIGDFVRPGQTVQFHLRDAETADAELQQLLAAARRASEVAPAAGLLFTCNGRGTRLFSEPHHDAKAVQLQLGDIPLAGFSAAGEIGPIGGSNFLHGFTASLALVSLKK